MWFFLSQKELPWVPTLAQDTLLLAPRSTWEMGEIAMPSYPKYLPLLPSHSGCPYHYIPIPVPQEKVYVSKKAALAGIYRGYPATFYDEFPTTEPY
jgi:hypothetical protein